MVECSHDRVVWGRRVQCHKVVRSDGPISAVGRSDYKDIFH